MSEETMTKLYLQPNEFTDKTDSIGFFELDYEPDNFLSLYEIKTERLPIIDDYK